MKGRLSSKVTYFVSWRNWTDRILFNVIQTIIAPNFLKKDKQEMDKYVRLCDDLVCMFSPVHAEFYDFTSAIPCTATESMLIPDDPAFTEKGNLIPLEELKIYKRVYWTDTIITILPFCRHERYGYGFEVSRYHKSKDTMGSNDLEDPQMWGLYVLPETRGE